MYGALVALLVGLVTTASGAAAPAEIDPAGHVPDIGFVASAPEPDEHPDHLDPNPLDYAIADFAAHTDANPDDIEVALNQNVTWPDGSLGCPQPDHIYLPIQVNGYLIVLHAPPAVATYHGAQGQLPTRCDRPDPSLTGPDSW